MGKNEIEKWAYDLALLQRALAQHGILRVRLSAQVLLDGDYRGLRSGTVIVTAATPENIDAALNRVATTLREMVKQ